MIIIAKIITIIVTGYIHYNNYNNSSSMPMLAAAVGQSKRQLLPQRFRAASAQLPRISGDIKFAAGLPPDQFRVGAPCVLELVLKVLELFC